MCYTLFLSTTSSEDLSPFNSEVLRFESTIPDGLLFSNLLHPNTWYVGTRTGCSCSFRHLSGPEFKLGVPEEWFPEEKSDIEATLLFIRVVRSLISKGERVDCVDRWPGNEAEVIPWVSINLSQILDEEFRFFEDHHFDFI
jgi:hypothetical protein